MDRLLALSSVRIGPYIAASGGVSHFFTPSPATLTLTFLGGLVFILGVVGHRLPFAQQVPYLLVLLAVGAVTLGLGGLLDLLSGTTSGSALGPVMRLVAAALGGLLFAVALRALATPKEL